MLGIMHSDNSKVGDVAATYAPIDSTCPTSCPLKGGNGCYAEGGNVGLQVSRLQRELEGLNGDTVAILEGDEISHMATHAPKGHPMRVHVSGDSATNFRAMQVARGADVWPGPIWTYTHAWRDVPRSSWGRVSVLASCESIKDVARANVYGYAGALVVAHHPADGRAWVDDATGIKVIPCPQQTRGKRCTDCKLCMKDAWLRDQRACVSFAAHGATHKRVLNVLR